jgi:hypothetical protein
MGQNEAPKIVRLNVDEKLSLKLKARHRDLRDVVHDTGKSLQALYADWADGWPYLLQYFARARQEPITLDDASDIMDTWIQQPDPKTGKKRELSELGKLLLEVMDQSGFVRITRPEMAKDKDGEDDEDREGNAPPEIRAVI